MMRYFKLCIVIFLGMSLYAYAGTTINPDTGRLDITPDIQEEDGDPIVYTPDTIKFTNGTVTDNADGTVSISISGTIDDDVTVNSVAVDTTANFKDGDIDWTLTDGGVGGPDDITATVECADCVTLTTETSGNYVASITNGTGISGGDAGSEGATLTLSATLGIDIAPTEMTSADFGDFTCNGTVCTNDADSIALGTDTTGNYVSGLTAGTGISISGTAGEGWSPTVTNTGDTTSDTIADDDVIDLTSEITGTLPVGNGGTGAISLSDGYVLLGSGTGAITPLNITAKGSLLVGDGTTDPQALAVGTNTYVLTADSAETLGVKWAAASSKNSPVIGTFSRDTTLASGTQAITGVGFQPSVVQFFALQNSTLETSVNGYDDGTNRYCIMYDLVDSVYKRITTASIYDKESGTASYEGYISSMDSDGFTITWTKSGSPSGTLDVYYTAFD